jgi:predicted nucleic acid-binding protein
MGYLIDTCILSELRKPRPHAGVVAWMGGIQPDEAFLSVLTLGEIRRGIELRRTKDTVATRSLERWLRGLETHYSDRILPVTPAIADRWGRLSPDQPLPVTDGLIAATALEHKLTVVTRNTADFRRSGASVFDPFLVPKSP